MDARIGIRAFLLVVLTLAISGCASTRWYANYRPPTEVNGYEFDSPVTAQPETLQLVAGEGFEFWLAKEAQPFDVNYASYFNPEDKSPFSVPVTNVQYLYCMFGDRPGLCGSKIVYESEEANHDEEFLSKIHKTKHEQIIAELIAKHGPPQIAEKYTQTVIEDTQKGATYRGPINPIQRRVWCDFSRRVPKRCNRSIIAKFHARKGRGVIFYIDERMYRYATFFRNELKHQHPMMEVITTKDLVLNAKDKAWWEEPVSLSNRRSYIPKERLHTEIELEARAKETGQPRRLIERALPREEFTAHWNRSFVNSHLKTTTPLLRDYWYGFWEGVMAHDFQHKFNLTDEAHKKWLAGAQSANFDIVYVSRGYSDGLAGTPKPPMVFHICFDDNLNVWQLLKCTLNGM